MINVIVPTYNESKNIKPFLLMLQDTLLNLERPYLIIVIDDNSPDGTFDIVKNMRLNNLELYKRAGKLGLATAYIDGLRHCKYEYTAILDSDLQHNPYTIADMFRIIITEKCDIVTGTRYNGGKVYQWGFKRKFISSTANNLARYVLGIKTSDLTGSFRLYKTSVLNKIVPKITCKGFGFQMEVIARAEKMGFKITEVPIVFYDRNGGESKFGINEIYLFVRAIFILYLFL